MTGSIWMIANTVASRVGSFVSQIFLAWWLTKSDFGVVGIALAISGVAAVLRDGGVRQILLKRHSEHDRLLGPCFWMAMGFNSVLAVLLTVAAFPLSRLYNDSRLIPMLAIIGWSIPLGTIGGILLTKLTADMRYRENASVITSSAMVRYVSSVVFAYFGLGPLSFVLPNVLCALTENTLTLYYSNNRPWRLAPHVNEWWSLFLSSRWALLASLGIAGMNQGSSGMIGLAAPLEVVGIYTFAYLIVVQIGILLSTNINWVLVPVFTRLAEDEQRKRAAVLRTLRQVSLIATFVSLGLAATYRPLESLVWHERWAASILPVQIMGAGYAINVLLCISLAVQQARGQFRAWGVGLLLLAAGTMLSAYLGTLLGKPELDNAIFLALHSRSFWPYVAERIWISSVYIALVTASFGVCASLIHLTVALKPLGVGRREVIKNALIVWSIGLLAGALTIAIDSLVDAPFRNILAQWVGNRAGVSIAEFLLFGANGLFFTGVYAILVRTVVPDALTEAIQMFPARLRAPAASIFRIDIETAPHATEPKAAPDPG
ncbi:MAG: oligosaccharide flippase family protein [Phycisphaeraceae bacterium]|nr:oligosaccharide flippase family protein [Phycisphaeraceae bacterium]